MTQAAAPPGARYFAQREAQERAAASAAVDVAVRRVHLALADRYAALVHGTALRGVPSAH